MHHFRLVMHHTCRKSPPSPCFQALSRFLDQLYAYTKSLFFATIMYIPGSLGTSLKQSSVWKASSMHQTFDSTIVFSMYPVRNCNILFMFYYHRNRNWSYNALTMCQTLFVIGFTNFTIQSIQIGLPVIVSINTLAGCMSSRARRSDM